ncbi:MAG: rubredoxin [Bacteroidales bacterium]|nr:rubredoxin [Bacteroidales bacterium]
MNTYKCAVCGHVYDPAEGDPDSGIAPGTAFEDIPDDWRCPICQVTKADYVLMD